MRRAVFGMVFAAALAPAAAGALEFKIANCSPSRLSLMVYDGSDLVRIVPSSFNTTVAPDTTADLRCGTAVCAVRLVSSGTTLDDANNDVMFEGARGVASDVTFYRSGGHWTWRAGITCLSLKQ